MAVSRNAESRFALNPTNLDISRSRFDRTSTVKTSFNVGELIPFYVDEVLPGDTFDVSCAKIVRMQPMVTPPMDDLFLDTYFFYVPNRLVWDHWVNFMGENDSSSWVPSVTYQVPVTSAPTTGWKIGTIADYFGIPTGKEGIRVNSLPLRAYAKIVNDWFRDENLVEPCVVSTGDAVTAGSNGVGLTEYEKGGKPFIAAKYHDYFTSCLPAPQKGDPVSISNASVSLPVVPVPSVTYDPSGHGKQLGVFGSPGAGSPNDGNYTVLQGDNTVTIDQPVEGSVSDINSTNGSYAKVLTPVNLAAVGSIGATTINELRLAFSIQKLLEKDARGGTRYISLIKTHFGITSPDARLQRSEYLGGNRIRINVNQIVQQSASVSGSTPQGNPVGLSVTHDNNDSFTRSFTEHGFVIGLMVARYPHTYQQGLERFWSRKTRYDYYFPVFANIGEMAVLTKEIYASGIDDVDNRAFGYQEAWADYRYKPSRVTGEMRSSAPKSLDVWHFADNYSTAPTLSAGWIAEDKSNIDRVLAVQSDVSNQLWADIVITNRTSRPMPLYSIPGLLDHH